MDGLGQLSVRISVPIAGQAIEYDILETVFFKSAIPIKDGLAMKPSEFHSDVIPNESEFPVGALHVFDWGGDPFFGIDSGILSNLV